MRRPCRTPRPMPDHRAFVIVNSVPLAGTVVLSCAADIAARPVLGQLTLGIVWSFVQLCVFVATAWRSETLAGPGGEG